MSNAFPPHRVVAALASALVLGACGAKGAGPSEGPSRSSTGRRTPPPVVRVRLVVRVQPYKLPAAIEREVAAYSGGQIYVAGGLDSSDTSTRGVFALGVQDGAVTTLGNLPQAFHDAAGAMLGGALFVFGGGPVTGTDLVQSFDVESRTGAAAGHLPVVLSDVTAATIGRTVYLVGGFDDKTPQAAIYATTDGVTFTTAGHLPAGLRYTAAAAANGKLYVAGGFDTSGPTDVVYAFDPATGRTTTVGKLPAPVAHATAFTLGGKVYVAGGRDVGGQAVATITVVDPVTGTIKAGRPLPQPVADAPAATDGTTVWLLGGWRGANVADVLQATLQPIH